MKNKNEEIEKRRRDEFLKLKKDQEYRRKRKAITDERRRTSKAGNIGDDSKQIQNLVNDYMNATLLSCPDGINMCEFIFF